MPAVPSFRTVNYTGNEVLTSYALPITPLYFIPERTQPDIDFYSLKKIVWDYGDGTSEEALTGQHTYRIPGVYNVSCFFYDDQGNSYPSASSTEVTIIEYLPSRLELTYENSPNTLTLTAGKISNPITLNRYTSYHAYRAPNTRVTIVPFASGVTTNYFDLGYESKRYSHLLPYSSFYFLVTGLKGLTEFVELSSFYTTSTNLFCKLENNEVVNCSKTDVGATFYGTSGTADIYFKSDEPVANVVLTFGTQPGALYDHTNTNYISISSCTVVPNVPASLSITSNGLDVEGSADTSFNINPIKFSNTAIGFVVKVKDSENFSVKGTDPLTLNNLTLTLTNGVTTFPATFTSYPSPHTEEEMGGVFKGYMIYNTPTTTSNVYISGYTVIDNQVIEGVSSTFTIYPSASQYNIAKHGEDIDMTAKFKEISFQPLFLETPNLFNEFLQSIFGTISSDQTSIGKLTYEKIKNFVSNNSVIDYANIDSLVSILDEFNANGSIKFSTNNYRYPAELARLVDILSINKSRLFGTKNTFNQNFNNRGYVDSLYYGTNLGNELTIQATITAGPSIVAYEKFSKTYKLLSTYQPVSAVNSHTYTLSDYDDSWGWGLILPSNGYGKSISNYYSFYNHISTPNNEITDSIINFEDPNNTINYNITSYNEWSKQDGIIANIISRQLYAGLMLIKE